MGGRESIRSIWSHYYSEAHGVIYVIDPELISSRQQEIVEVLSRCWMNCREPFEGGGFGEYPSECGIE